jgi:DNA polymerase
MRNCRPYLDEQIDVIRPRVILALGAPAAKSFLGERFSITKQRGQWFEGPLGIPLLASFHPAYILRQTGGAMTEVKRMVWADLKQVRDRLAAPPPAPPADAAPEQHSLFD